mmetsp:Transcript_12864/g.19536  ORF Transcript_12864/g.19536 Transcript_12864/m.19536 type:complete len:156 (-) Transcript_12864:250-717(-)
MPGLPNDVQEEVKECFDLFDRTGAGKIPVDMLGKIIRSVGQTPSNAEVQDYVKEIDSDGTGTFDYASLVALLERHWKAPPDPNQIVEAFKIFDPDGKGQISASEMSTVMTSLGEKLTSEEVKAMLAEADPSNTGSIDYKAFVEHMAKQTINLNAK